MDLTSYNRLGQVFSAANVSAKSIVAVSTTETGVILYNPVGSTKIFLIVNIGFAWTTAAAAVHNLGIAIAAPNPTTIPASTTAIGSGVKQMNGSGNSGLSVAQAYDAATLPTAPVAVMWFGGAMYATGAGNSPYSLNFNVDGAVALVPGAVACLCAVTTTMVGLGHMTWLELPIQP